ncbi:MAG: glycerol kinase GlpK [Oligoflexus sp.]
MPNQKFILALDQGTTSSRAMVIDKKGQIVSSAQEEFKQFYPKSGWVEHDPEDILNSQLAVAKQAVHEVGVENVAAIGITNQRETTIVWDRKTGEAIYHAIVWQDRRTSRFCDELKSNGMEQILRQKTGLMADAYFSASKIKWLLDNVNGAREKAERGELAFGTVDSWLIWHLTGRKSHVTDITNASRTLLFDIHKQDWDAELLKIFDVPASMLPKVKDCSADFGICSSEFFGREIPITGVAGDQQAASFGQMCTEKGMIKNTYGTGCFLVMNTGQEAIQSKNQLLTTIAWRVGNETTYALEGSIFVAGAVVQWIRDGLGLIEKSEDIEKLAKSVSDNGGVYMVPAFTGLGAPHWDQYARGAIFGLTRGSQKGHIARAALEAIAYQTRDVVDAMESDSGIPLKELRVDGGASINNDLMQFQSDVLNTKVIRPKILETTVLGAAFFAGLHVGFWESIDQIKHLWEEESRFQPSADRTTFRAYLKKWHQAVDHAKGWAKDDQD